MDEIGAAYDSVGLTGGAKIFDGMARTYDFVAANEEIGSEPIEAALAKGRSVGEVVRILGKDL